MFTLLEKWKLSKKFNFPPTFCALFRLRENIVVKSTNQWRSRVVPFSTSFSREQCENVLIKTKTRQCQRSGNSHLFSYAPHLSIVARMLRSVFGRENIFRTTKTSELVENSENRRRWRAVENIFRAAHQFQFNLVNKRMFQWITHVTRLNWERYFFGDLGASPGKMRCKIG